MTPLQSSTELLTLFEARAALIRKVTELSGSDIGRARRVEIEIEATDPLSWLASQQAEIKTYWQSRDKGFEMAGIGGADVIFDDSAIDYDHLCSRIAQNISEDSRHCRYLGGFRFSCSDTLSDPDWQPFGAFRFVLPRVEIVRRGDQRTYLACNLLPGQTRHQIEDCVSTLEGMAAKERRLIFSHPIRSRSDSPDKEGWHSAVDAALKRIEEGRLKKVVLARKVALEVSGIIDPWALLALMVERSDNTCQFAFQPVKGAAFIGSTPELLYSREGRRFKTEAVAGTRPRGESSADDTRLGQELLASAKDRYEQRLVTDFLSDGLDTLTSSHNGRDEISLLRTARVQHLVTRMHGTLRPDITDAAILKTLHPTPAVGGVPRDTAFETISSLESFNRNWYAGPVGWIGADGAEFMVGIRSALVHEHDVTLYSGAGIVDGSVPEEEWDEIEQKISSILKALDGQ